MKFSSGKTIRNVLDANNGIGAGFDTLRLVLALAVICWHSIPISYGWQTEKAIWNGPYGRPFMAVMPAFFALSGFLVMGSAIRVRQLNAFLAARVLRIVPALAMEISISALVMGALLTTLPLSEYFTSRGLLEYIGSLFGKVVYELPGVVFKGNAYSVQVNNNLWTIPPELLSYVFMSILIVVGLFKHRTYVIGAACLVLILNILADLSLGTTTVEARWPSRFLLYSFAVGTTLFMWRDRLPYDGRLATICALFGLIGLRTPGIQYVAIIAIVYATIYLGCSKLPSTGFLSRGDYSYGIYLYGFPLQQLVAYLSPWKSVWYLNLAFAIPASVAIAMLSWRFVEKPALSFEVPHRQAERRKGSRDRSAGQLRHSRRALRLRRAFASILERGLYGEDDVSWPDNGRTRSGNCSVTCATRAVCHFPERASEGTALGT